MRALLFAVLLSCAPPPAPQCRELTTEQFGEVQRQLQRELVDGGFSWARWCYPFGDGGVACTEVTIEAR